MKVIIQFIKDFIWFMKTSCSFLDKGMFYIIVHGGIHKSIWAANENRKYNKLTEEEKLLWYVNENRTFYI